MSVLKAIVNGVQTSSISINDRGFHYGDGVFETICIYNQSAILWNEHYQRLKKGCLALNISAPSKEFLEEQLARLLDGLDNKNYVIKIIVTRGESERGYKAPDTIEANIVILLQDYPKHNNEYWNDGVSVTVCKTMLSHQPKLVGLKHMNRLEQVLARQEWNDEYQEGIMTDTSENVVEGIMSNIIIRKNNDYFTPKINKAGVQGIIRNLVIGLCEKAGIYIKEDTISLEFLKQSDEILLSNSLIGLWPVKNLDGKDFINRKGYKTIMQLLIEDHSVNYGAFGI